ncbi:MULTISPECIES: cell wall hydrolase [Alkalihalophilus]|uniref:Cell wall hydrolase (Sporulation) n=3 Tax=Alkalihalophilus TaxID=2893060 RepID=D3FPU6_ALKPO|nr:MULTISPECIES: cell wall hydrolase [Alkalihalophilus]ADC49506.1 cell wall hydrolase (sporulation) [Alkalihalophilus pseudofirmus OF4]ERN51785.1 cell wall hydrolase [Alkalihalophilus marmarensis DSM 21297]MDV2886953.1 cell wall hydrolase [Alkalihalophilus pseudofirmus]MEC2072834.1 cell wall hydrolase [Alkalihalophilus marmarensis]OLS38750.1 cell wall hydrolase [Alkalihalophilus pseudofirmus]
MAVIKTSSSDIDMLARLMRAEAEGEGEIGMMAAGNVMVNRVRVGCLDFTDVTSVPQMAFQSPGGFEAVQKSYFYQHARERDKRLARRAVAGERTHPAEFALWFFRPDGACPAQWWGQWNSGRYKAHCFYTPLASECPEVYSTY